MLRDPQPGTGRFACICSNSEELGIATEHNVSTSTSHVCCNGNGTLASRHRNHGSFALVVLGVENLVLDLLLRQELGDRLGLLHRRWYQRGRAVRPRSARQYRRRWRGILRLRLGRRSRVWSIRIIGLFVGIGNNTDVVGGGIILPLRFRPYRSCPRSSRTVGSNSEA